jgi:hypothetical protein
MQAVISAAAALAATQVQRAWVEFQIFIYS